MNTFTWDAEKYAKNSSNQASWARKLITKLNLRGNETVLDIGCGDGKITAEIAKMLPEGKIIGIDASQEMIDYATATHTKNNPANLKFTRMDANELKWEHPFDIVFSNAALHWIQDQKNLLKLIANILKPHGRMLTSCGGKGNHEALNQIFRQIISETKWKPYFPNFYFPWHYYTSEEYRNWLLEAGLTPHRVELIPKDSTFLTIKEWPGLRYMKQCVPKNLSEDFAEEVEKKYTDIHSRDEKGLIHAQMIRLEVEAEKKEGDF